MEPLSARQRTWLVGYLLGRALVVTVVGLLLIVRPHDTARTVARIGGGVLLMIGLIDLAAPLARASSRPLRLPLVLRGAVTIGLGLIVLTVTEATITVVSIVLGMQLVVSGGVSLMVSVRLRHRVRGWQGFAARGAIALTAGAMAIGWPGITVTVLAALLGTQWLISGAVSTVVAVRVAAAT